MGCRQRRYGVKESGRIDLGAITPRPRYHSPDCASAATSIYSSVLHRARSYLDLLDFSLNQGFDDGAQIWAAQFRKEIFVSLLVCA